MRIQGNAPWRWLRKRAQKIPPLFTVTGNKEYVSPNLSDINRKKSMPFEILEVVCVESRTDACCLAEQSGNLFLVLC